MLIETDASMIGWGAVCQGIRTVRLWSHQERDCHINVLELSATMLAVQTFAKDNLNTPRHIHLRNQDTFI